MTPKNRAPFWPFLGEGFWAISSDPFFSLPLGLLLHFATRKKIPGEPQKFSKIAPPSVLPPEALYEKVHIWVCLFLYV